MDVKPLRTEADYKAARAQVSAYFDNEPAAGTAEADHFEVLFTLVHAYEEQHYPIAPPDPVEAIKFRMEQAGLTPKDLTKAIGAQNRVYEVLKGSRGLTLRMIRKLHGLFQIPAESLIAPPRLGERLAARRVARATTSTKRAVRVVASETTKVAKAAKPGGRVMAVPATKLAAAKKPTAKKAVAKRPR